ncbi:MAG TPA: serine/threonine-protein kinase [Pyrinomonadaceae bacterium]|nr:serine/threonine-protein kinase [Pyrinomonadaceae bacterium]
MNKDDWDRIQEIFCAALEQPEAEWPDFVEKACAGDPDCKAEVMSLLAAHASLSFPEPPLRPQVEIVGTKIGDRYDVERELPGGGMGRVFCARDLQLNGKYVVIKTLPPAWARDADAVRRFEREIKALASLDDPNVVSALGTGRLRDPDATPYLVMQYVDGVTVRTEITKGVMKPARVASIFQQVGVALAHVHQKGILHLDLKPENIMLQVLDDGREVVKVLDFGIARIKDSLAATGVINTALIGTQAYMSPEQFRPGETITSASDIYSMAVVACEMLTGRRPFETRPTPRIERHNVFPACIPKKAQRVLLRALSFKPEDRYANAKEFGDELADALLKHAEAKEPETEGQWSRYVKRIAAVAGVLAIVSLVSFGVYKYLTKPLPPTKGFNYWLTVQPMLDGKESKEPYKSNGDELFERDDKFRLSVATVDDGGYLYVFYEGPSEKGDITFRLSYPKKGTNGSANLGANQTIETEWEQFRGPKSSANFWIVWSVSPVNELESAKDQALANPQAELTGQNLVNAKQFLTTTKDAFKVWDASFKEGQVSKVRARRDLVLTLTQFKHR